MDHLLTPPTVEGAVDQLAWSSRNEPPHPADRVPEGSVGRRGRLDSQEPLEPLEDGDYLETTDPKETQYDTEAVPVPVPVPVLLLFLTACL